MQKESAPAPTDLYHALCAERRVCFEALEFESNGFVALYDAQSFRHSRLMIATLCSGECNAPFRESDAPFLAPIQ